MGDTLDKRAKVDDKFSFNDRNVSQYKINFAIHNNKITMYTFGMTKAELDLTSKTLDYYCKKYFSMEYTAKIINQKVNSYSVDIVFTNYSTLCQFIMELSKVLNTKINLLDNSIGGCRKQDIMKMLLTGISRGLGSALRGGGSALVGSVQGIIVQGIDSLGNREAQQLGLPMNRGDYNNEFLKTTLGRLHYVDGFNYTTSEEKAEANMSLVSGVLIVSVISEKSGDFDKQLWKNLKTKVRRSDTGKVIVYTYALKDTREFELVLKKLMSIRTKINIYDK